MSVTLDEVVVGWTKVKTLQEQLSKSVEGLVVVAQRSGELTEQRAGLQAQLDVAVSDAMVLTEEFEKGE